MNRPIIVLAPVMLLVMACQAAAAPTPIVIYVDAGAHGDGVSSRF